MAKTPKIVKNDQCRAVVTRYAKHHAELKPINSRRRSSAARSRPPSKLWANNQALARQPCDAHPVRLRNRDVADSRLRGYLRKFVGIVA